MYMDSFKDESCLTAWGHSNSTTKFMLIHGFTVIKDKHQVYIRKLWTTDKLSWNFLYLWKGTLQHFSPYKKKDRGALGAILCHSRLNLHNENIQIIFSLPPGCADTQAEAKSLREAIALSMWGWPAHVHRRNTKLKIWRSKQKPQKVLLLHHRLPVHPASVKTTART